MAGQTAEIIADSRSSWNRRCSTAPTQSSYSASYTSRWNTDIILSSLSLFFCKIRNRWYYCRGWKGHDGAPTAHCSECTRTPKKPCRWKTYSESPFTTVTASRNIYQRAWRVNVTECRGSQVNKSASGQKRARHALFFAHLSQATPHKSQDSQDWNGLTDTTWMASKPYIRTPTQALRGCQTASTLED